MMHAACPLQQHHCRSTSPMQLALAVPRTKWARSNDVQAHGHSLGLAICSQKDTAARSDTRLVHRVQYGCLLPLGDEQPHANHVKTRSTAHIQKLGIPAYMQRPQHTDLLHQQLRKRTLLPVTHKVKHSQGTQKSLAHLPSEARSRWLEDQPATPTAAPGTDPRKEQASFSLKALA